MFHDPRAWVNAFLRHWIYGEDDMARATHICGNIVMAYIVFRLSSFNYFVLVGVGVFVQCAEKLVVGERES